MTASRELDYRADVLLMPAALVARPASVDALNGSIEAAGLGRPVRAAEATPAGSALVVLPVTVDARVVLDTLRAEGAAAGAGGAEVAALAEQVGLDLRFAVGTAPGPAEDVQLFALSPAGAADRLVLSGKPIGHAAVAWQPAEECPTFPARRPIADLPGGRRPVLALLDTRVDDHPRLQAPTDDPFWIDAAARGWTPPGLWEPGPNEIGSHHGHGTFIAGLVRQHAPDAQLLSVALVGDDGRLAESSVVRAVDWLAAEVRAGRPVDVVCMAFGRSGEPGNASPSQPMRHAITELGRLGVQVVASAGNDGTCQETYPAAWATDPGSPVDSVGAGTSATDHESFSNRGSWVEHWVPGRDVLGILPVTPVDGDPDGCVRWSGTSFAAGRHAAKLAQRLATDRPVPTP